jgi:prolyl oligopeptidase
MRLFPLFPFFIGISIPLMAQQNPSFTGKYPATRTIDTAFHYFDTTVNDPYYWLENDTAAPTRDWVKKQNKTTADYLAKIPYRDQIKARLSALWNYEKYTIPYYAGEYMYFSKNNGLQNQYVLYRQAEGKPAELFLDPNSFSKDGTSSLAGISFSKDGSMAAFQISEGGSDWHKLIVINTKTKKRIDDTLHDIKFGDVAWLNNSGFYYSSYDRPKEGSVLSGKTQYHKLYFHKLGTPQASDVLIFGGEQQPRRYISAQLSEDQLYLIISAANSTYGNELYLVNLRDNASPTKPIIPIITGFDFNNEFIYEVNDRIYILTNKEAPNGKLISISTSTPSFDQSEVMIPETENPLTVTTCSNKFFAHYLVNALAQVKQYGIDGKLENDIKLPGLGTVSGFNGRMEDSAIYYSFTSYKDPLTIYKYNAAIGISKVFKKPNINIIPEQYMSEQVFYTSKDGTKIPMMLTYKYTARKAIKHPPVMLYGYGGFNINITPSFSPSILAFMENGGIYAVANIRGGAEYGEKWHEAGTKMNKQNVFDDFIAAAQYLIDTKITSKDRIAISGASNGGLLIGACLTQRPDLFKVCFPSVGVLDMLRYHKFTAGAGWASDYGTADDSKDMFQYLYHYSPVHNVKKNTCYPATMILTADHDDRVVPMHSFKFAAALQAAQSCNNPVLINIQSKAGHGAGKPTSMLIQEQADKWAFLFWNMGLNYDTNRYDKNFKTSNIELDK